MAKIIQDIDAKKISISIEMLKEHVKDSSIEPLLSALEKLKQEPDNEAYLEQFSVAFNVLGIVQGAVLTYAPYICSILPGDLFGDD